MVSFEYILVDFSGLHNFVQVKKGSRYRRAA